jgi:hypothetical protein
MSRFESATLRRVCARGSAVEAVRVRPFLCPTLSRCDLFGVYRTYENEHSGTFIDGIRPPAVLPPYVSTGFCARVDDRV